MRLLFQRPRGDDLGDKDNRVTITALPSAIKANDVWMVYLLKKSDLLANTFPKYWWKFSNVHVVPCNIASRFCIVRTPSAQDSGAPLLARTRIFLESTKSL